MAQHGATGFQGVRRVNIVVRVAVGWEEQVCAACGRLRADYIEIHLRHAGTKIILCSECDDGQLQKPRVVRETEKR